MISVKNLIVSYPSAKKNALDDVSLDIPDGSWISIIGHNGSGKSTLAKALVGLLEIKSGSIYFDDLDIKDEENIKEIRKQIGIVFQNPDNQFVGVTVYNDLAFGLENRCLPRNEIVSKVEDAINKIHMEKYRDREPYQLSGGQKQKVAIGSVIACDLRYIIFDEATSMLDPEGSKEIVELIKELKTKENKTIITITHDLELAQLSDYIYVLKNGKVSGSFAPCDLKDKESILEDSNLIAPLNLKIYNRLKKEEKFKNDKELLNLLWESNLIT